MKNEIKTTGTEFDVDLAMVDVAGAIYVAVSHLNNLYVSIHPTVWHENDAVEAIRISEEIKFIKNKLIYIKALGYKLDAYRDENE